MEFSAWCVFWSRKPCWREWICTFNKDNLTTLEQQKAKLLHRFRYATNRTSHWLFPVVSWKSLTIFSAKCFYKTCVDDRHSWSARNYVKLNKIIFIFFFFQLQRTSLTLDARLKSFWFLTARTFDVCAFISSVIIHYFIQSRGFCRWRGSTPVALLKPWSLSKVASIQCYQDEGVPYCLCCIIYCFILPSQTVSGEVLGLPDVIILCKTIEEPSNSYL